MNETNETNNKENRENNAVHGVDVVVNDTNSTQPSTFTGEPPSLCLWPTCRRKPWDADGLCYLHSSSSSPDARRY